MEESKQNNQEEQKPKLEKPAAKPKPKSKPKPDQTFILSSSPHQVKTDDVKTVMKHVNMALLPAIVASVVYFGFR